MLNKIMSKLNNFKNDESGASAIEYAVMAAVLVVVILAAIYILGTGSTDGSGTAGLKGSFDNITDKIDAINPAS